MLNQRSVRQAAKQEYSFDAPLPAGAPDAAFNGAALVTDLARYNELLGLPPPSPPARAPVAMPPAADRASPYTLFAGYGQEPAALAAPGWGTGMFGGYGGSYGGDAGAWASAPEAALLAAAAVATDGAPTHAQTATEQDLELNELMAALMCK